ncbi:hypothetical protein [Flavihumibacter profundi]|jgi:hypothetical protein|uniref:hypothetical protein n=1 Tax=Flavihumibacter profundi TaxID=2716883 RepID=UPI001CC663B1|nr:hypothetical protein [Flavihumibacter profundi]MBZ5859581.1 hypothetical protein [Flavihumibacter profundi]
MPVSIIRKFVFICILGAAPIYLNAQPPITVTLQNEATAIPFTKLFTRPVHPGVQLGTEGNYSRHNLSRLYQTISIGYIFHRHLFKGIYIHTALGYDYGFHSGFNLKAQVGLGYMQSFTTGKEYQFSQGEYKAGRDRGNSRFIFSVAPGLGYRLQQNNTDSPEIFTLYNCWFEYPYSPGFIPVMTHISQELGYSFYPDNK